MRDVYDKLRTIEINKNNVKLVVFETAVCFGQRIAILSSLSNRQKLM